MLCAANFDAPKVNGIFLSQLSPDSPTPRKKLSQDRPAQYIITLKERRKTVERREKKTGGKKEGRKQFLLGTDIFLHRKNSSNRIVCFLLGTWCYKMRRAEIN